MGMDGRERTNARAGLECRQRVRIRFEVEEGWAASSRRESLRLYRAQREEPSIRGRAQSKTGACSTDGGKEAETALQAPLPRQKPRHETPCLLQWLAYGPSGRAALWPEPSRSEEGPARRAKIAIASRRLPSKLIIYYFGIPNVPVSNVSRDQWEVTATAVRCPRRAVRYSNEHV